MTIQNFEKMHGKQGGMKQLTHMRDSCATLQSIADQFKVSKTRVGQWMIDIFGQNYDPRYDRRRLKIEAVEKLVKKFGVEKTKELYAGINKEYLKKAIKNLKKK